MQTFLKPFKKLAGRVLLGLKPLAIKVNTLDQGEHNIIYSLFKTEPY
jgi:hypothetical protein